MIYAVVEKIEYQSGKINRFGDFQLITTDVFYKLKFKLDEKGNAEWQDRFQKFCAKYNSVYEFLEHPENDIENYYKEEFSFFGCYSSRCSLSREFSCWCALMSVFLMENGFELMQREGNEEFWVKK